FWNAHLNSNFGSYPLWVANYGASSPKIPAGWTTWNFWQHSQSGTIAGVTGNVDLNNFNGTQDDLNASVIGQASSNADAPDDSDNNSATSSADTSSSPTVSGDGSGGGYTYIVQAGDTLDKIAASFQVSVSDLQSLNRIKDPNDISVGQILTIPT